CVELCAGVSERATRGGQRGSHFFRRMAKCSSERWLRVLRQNSAEVKWQPLRVKRPAELAANRSTRHRASCRQAHDAAGGGCRTRELNTHSTESREVLYPWHPWHRRHVWIREVRTSGG